MTALRTEADGRLVVETPAYRLSVAANGRRATLSSPDGEHWATLRPLVALDTTDGPDETLAVEAPNALGGDLVAIEVERRSTRWKHSSVTLVCGDEGIEIRATVRGRGDLMEAHLLAARSLIPCAPTGLLPSGTSFKSLFSPNPGDPGRLVRPASESAVIGVAGDGEPGRGNWFFTPAPLYLAFTTAAGVTDPRERVDAGWVGLGIAAPVEELRFVELEYRPRDRAFSLVLDYDGHTRVDCEFSTPSILLTPGAADPYAGLRRHRDELAARGAAPPVAPRSGPDWWTEPIFCGWGAQCHLARANGTRAADFATQERYDAFLAELEAQGVVPATVVIDDKWQKTYGENRPDPAKWPDLKGWIAARHEQGRHVLLWWKAWDPEGLPPELCLRNPDGTPVALDPGNPRTREALRASVAGMVAPEGLDADGLKIDFTARTPAGRALLHDGPAWGIALLHALLAIVYDAAKEAKPDALVITQTPHPAFVDVTDMVRLNDMLRMDDPGPMAPVLPQMRYRADVVRAACPELPIDTDDWCVPDLRTWRAYAEEKLELGVPALYYVTHLDASGEKLEPEDYALLRRTWDTWRKRQSTARA